MKQKKRKNAKMPEIPMMSEDQSEPKNEQKKSSYKASVPKPIAKFSQHILSTVLILILITAGYSLISGNIKEVKDVSLSEIAQNITEGKVTELTVDGTTVTASLADGVTKKATKEAEASLTETLKNYGVTSEALSKTPLTIKTASGFMYWFMSLAPIILPIMLVGFMIWMLFRQMKGGAMQAMTFGQSRAKIIDPSDTNNRVTFDDVAGCKEAKIELVEIVDFLKNPKKFLDIGARVPKGVLLTGSPGTGKTMLARAVAGEAQVPFFHLSGSEFVEMFAGVGASRVRDLFQMAKKAAPAIVFVDEIDAVGRMRGIGNGGNNDEREQTLNQILVEMDGFEPNEKVIVMAATNRSDVLDPALLRPGRFDRHVTLDLPDRIDREAILAVHAKKKPLAADVNLKVIAERTPGFSGADLYSIMNEGAILAAREDRKEVTQSDLIKSIEKVMLGPERKSHLMTPEEKKITAYHEAGHALVASVLPHADPVHKISIISRGRAGGYTIKLPLDDRKLQSRQTFLDDLAMSLGGYVVEKMVFGDVTTGPSNDLQVASDMARRMVTEWGMSDVIGPVAVETSRTRLYRTQGIEEKTYSETIATRIDEEVKRLMSEARDRAEEVVTQYRHVLDAIANKLIEVETLEQEAYNELISSYGITPRTS